MNYELLNCENIMFYVDLSRFVYTVKPQKLEHPQGHKKNHIIGVFEFTGVTCRPLFILWVQAKLDSLFFLSEFSFVKTM